MRGLVPEGVLEERRRLGLDRKDEMWDGVLHMVPPASSVQGLFGNDLSGTLRRPAKDRGLWHMNEPGIFDPDVPGMSSYRVPDLGYARPEDVSDRGIEGRAVLVVEVLSPGDESQAKLRFYRQVGVEELLFVDPRTRAFEVRRPAADDWLVAIADDEGWTELVGLGVSLGTEGGRLQVRTDLGIEEV